MFTPIMLPIISLEVDTSCKIGGGSVKASADSVVPLDSCFGVFKYF